MKGPRPLHFQSTGGVYAAEERPKAHRTNFQFVRCGREATWLAISKPTPVSASLQDFWPWREAPQEILNSEKCKIAFFGQRVDFVDTLKPASLRRPVFFYSSLAMCPLGSARYFLF
jgi:hypothetical protein